MRPLAALALAAPLALASCQGNKAAPAGDADGGPDPADSSDLGPSTPPPTPKGMIWVPPGVLLAGTPEGRLPRQPDAEMPGSQVVMRGFFIDEFPYPNEPGAIPLANVSQPEAAELCEKQGKRLCTELEWERACKGPDNRTYPYGDVYRAADCNTGAVRPGMPPVGLLPNCRSGFGVRDLHGGVAQWTSSPWGRGSSENLSTTRGGNGAPGDVFARCAHAAPHRPSERSPSIGLRCCAHDRNAAEVTLNITRGDPLQSITVREEFQRLVGQSPPPDLKAALGSTKAPFKLLLAWRWRPVGNEEMLLLSGCAHPGPLSICGVAAYRSLNQAYEPLAYAGSGWWLPSLNETDDPRDFYVYGGDKDGGFRRFLGYSYGRIIVGSPERNIKKKKDKKR